MEVGKQASLQCSRDIVTTAFFDAIAATTMQTETEEVLSGYLKTAMMLHRDRQKAPGQRVFKGLKKVTFRRWVAGSNGGQTENMGETVEKRPVPGQETARTATETKRELHFISPPTRTRPSSYNTSHSCAQQEAE